MTIIEYKLHPIPQGGMKVELQARQRAIHAIYPMKISPNDDTEMNDTQVNATIKAWVDDR